MPVLKALLKKCHHVFNLDNNLPDLPPTASGPVFFNDFQMYSTSRKWRNFMEKIVSFYAKTMYAIKYYDYFNYYIII